MKKEYINLVISVVVSLFLFTGTVFAEETNVKTCSAKQLSELRQIASNIKVSYLPRTEIVTSEYVDSETGTKPKYTKRYLDIKIYNMDPKLYIEVSNNIKHEQVVTSNDIGIDGTITFRQNAIDRKVDYTFIVKSSEYGCEMQRLRTIKLTLPMYNAYSQLDICTEIPDYYLCQEYVTQQVDGSTFYDKVDAYKEKIVVQGEKNDKENNTGVANKMFKDASKYKYLIVGLVVALGVVITIVIIKRKENI